MVKQVRSISEKSGNPSKARLHEGAAGSGVMKKSLWNKEARDAEPPAEKEPRKSRGLGG